MIICPYCGKSSVLVTGKAIYPDRLDLVEKNFWSCSPCNAYVGCHIGTTKPFGQLANSKLRKLRKRAHAVFDPIWESGQMSREEAYSWLSRQLDIKGIHIGSSDVDLCKRIIQLCAIDPDKL